MIELYGQIAPQRLHGLIYKVAGEGSGGPLQAKTAYPSHDEQIIAPDEDYYGLVSVTVKPVPRLPFAAVSVETPTAIIMSYNGVELADFSELYATYPHRVIVAGSSGVYFAMMAPDVIYKTDSYYRTEKNTANPILRYIASDNNWIQTTTAYRLSTSTYPTVIWSSHDVPAGSADATDIYFEGTDSMPVA